MNYNEMSFAEIKDYAKSLGIPVGNSGKEKLISKIKEKEMTPETKNIELSGQAVEKEVDKPIENSSASIIDSIANAIDEMDESANDDVINEDINLALDDEIPVKSITFGGLTYRSRSTNAIYRWPQIGSIEYMTVADLNEMNSYKPVYLNRPLVILMDERAMKKYRLQKVYENVAQINNLAKVFNSDMNTIEEKIDMALDANMRDILISKSRQMIENGTLSNINVIRLLEKKLQHDLSEAV